MLIDETRFFWKNMMERAQPIMDLYSQFRPLIMLPFNIWLFFVTLPIRFLFFLSSTIFPSNVKELQAKTLEIKEKVITTDATQLRKRAVASEERPIISGDLPKTTTSKPSSQGEAFSWYTMHLQRVESKGEEQLQRRAIPKDEIKPMEAIKSVVEAISKPIEAITKPMETIMKPDESAQLKEQLSAIEKREQSTLAEKSRLELELADLASKYETDEQALASFEHDKRRYQKLISVEQKKCFDFQQTIISLKNQLKMEHESKVQAEQQIDEMKKKTKSDKRKAQKATKASKAASEPTPVEESSTKPAAALESSTHSESAWHSDAHKGFTEMVADAQRELEHKKFSDVVKESLMDAEPVVDSTPEFTLVGGASSTKHLVGDLNAPINAHAI